MNKQRQLEGITGYIVSIIAVIMSIFHIYTALFGTFNAFLQRSAHLGFALILCYALFSFNNKNKNKQNRIQWYDITIMLVTVFIFGYLAYNSVDISARLSYVQPLTILEISMGILLCIFLLEATRRALGLALAIIVLVSYLYALWGNLIPIAKISPPEFTLMWIIDHLVYTTFGIFSTPLGVSATFIFMFVLFGKFLEMSGAGKFFIDLAVSTMGRFRGGPAKIAVFASAIMGTISGSSVANTATTGSITIPMMKKTGYDKAFAGAVESVASTGGQFMPPIMGASAFIIASYLGIPYMEVAIAAIIPSILYYICLFYQVDLRAQRKGLTGMSKENIPILTTVLRDGFLFFIPLFTIVILLINGNTPMRAGIIAIITVVVVAALKIKTRMGPRKIIKTLDFGARSMTEVAIACGASGAIIGVLGLTGLGLKFSSLILSLSGGNLFLTLFLAMICSIILGMGLPTVAAYIVQVSLIVPALIDLGVAPLAAHLFIFFFAIVSNITPPVALAAFAAAAIAESKPIKTSIIALRLGIAAFILPFIFVYHNSILMEGSIVEILIAFTTALVGMLGLAAGCEGWFIRRVFWYERLGLIIGALILIAPSGMWNLLGLAILILVFLLQKYTFSGEKKATTAL